MGIYLGDTNLIPAASTTERGGIMIGDGLSINEGVASVNTNTIQTKLVSGTSIKTINSASILDSGNLSLQPTITSATELTAKTINAGLVYTTVAPTAANTNGLKIVVLTSEPATKYSGYLYVIVG